PLARGGPEDHRAHAPAPRPARRDLLPGQGRRVRPADRGGRRREGRRMRLRPLLIYGASDHGKVVAEAVRADGRFELLGFLDDDTHKWGRMLGGLPVLGELAALDGAPADALVALG